MEFAEYERVANEKGLTVLF